MKNWSIGLLVFGLCACSSPPTASTSDAGTDSSSDAVTDTAADNASGDGSVRETGADGRDDVAIDVSLDVATDVGTDVATDVGTDAGMDAADDVVMLDVQSNDAVVPRADVECGGTSQPCCAATACAAGLTCLADGTCGACAAPFAMCGAVCVDPSVSTAHCGGCNRPCAAGQFCSGGTCQSPCAAPLTSCGGACVQVGADPNHCTGCGVACVLADATAGCTAGACTVVACSNGFGDCDGNAANGCETDLRVTATHCGTCGRACAAGGAGTVSCSMGSCTLSCPAGLGDCDADPTNGCETDLRINPAHCASCDHACPDGVGAATATCTAGACGTATCAAGTADCDGVRSNGCEVDTDTSLASCGSCGNACVRANATTACVAGSCGITACATGFGDCDGDANNGCETSLTSTVDHCGTCATACPAPGGSTASCTAGVCGIAACASGTADCDHVAANGCEVNTGTSTTSCGSCGTACSFAQATATCVSGSCVMGACLGRNADCNGLNADGCEIDTSSNPTHCGGCGQRCVLANATSACAAGACAIAMCAPGYRDCDGNAANGCEASVNSDGRNCGTCGHVCGAGAVCSGGACVSTCAAGLTSCSGTCASLATDVNNCGSCGHVCAAANGVASCSAGVCGVASCSAGYGNCDGNTANGCETDLRTSASHCGTCATVCSAANGTAACSGSVCTVSACNAGYGNCDGVNSNGCETQLTTNAAHCGSCSTQCSAANGTTACVAGACTVSSCNTGYRNCNGVASDGCEADIRFDKNNCGRCTNVCPAYSHAAAGCVFGQCGVSCNTDYASCDGNDTNGCETHISNDISNCGRCGNACNIIQGCEHGSCHY